MKVNGGAVWAAGGTDFPNGLDTTNVGSPPHRFWIMDNGDFQIHRYDSSTGAWSTKWKYSDNDASNFAKSGYPTTLEADGELCHPNYDKPSGSGSACMPQWCVSCPIGHIAVNMSVCVPCPQGTYRGNGSTACTRCDVGTYSNSSGSSACTGCDVGKYSNSSGASHCDDCPAGHTAVNASRCVPCPQGTYRGDGSTACTRCDMGTYSNSSGSSACTGCDVGKYSNSSGSSECTGCDVGKYSQSRAATTCTTCPEGSISGENSTRAEDCLCNNVLRYFGPPGGTCVHECSQEAVRAAFFEEHADRVEILRAEVSLEFTCKRVRLRACVSACVPLRICVREQNPYDMYTATRV